MNDWIKTSERVPRDEDGCGPSRYVLVAYEDGNVGAVRAGQVRYYAHDGGHPYWQRITPPAPEKSELELAREELQQWFGPHAPDAASKFERLIRAVISEGK